jgi:hypothetical protein
MGKNRDSKRRERRNLVIYLECLVRKREGVRIANYLD